MYVIQYDRMGALVKAVQGERHRLLRCLSSFLFLVPAGFHVYAGHRIALPDKFPPSQALLALHRDRYFRG